MDLNIKKSNLNDYCNMTDEQIVKLAQEDDKEALDFIIRKYTKIIKHKVKNYYICGADKDDVIQEGLIGLYEAIIAFNEEKFSSFNYFANICITRQIITAFNAANRPKNGPLNNYISLNKEIFGQSSDMKYEEVITSLNNIDPLEIYIVQEEIRNFEKKIDALLSDFEKKIFSMYIAGHSYSEMANILGCKVKRVDNALQRIKKKIETYLRPIRDRWLAFDNISIL